MKIFCRLIRWVTFGELCLCVLLVGSTADGQMDIEGDVNRDGVVNILDLVSVARNFTAQNVTDAPVPPAQIIVGAPIPKFPLEVGDTFTQTIAIHNATDLAAWQMEIVFNPGSLKVIDMTEGNFLEQAGIDAFFLSSASRGTIGASQTRIGRTPVEDEGGNIVQSELTSAVKGVSGTGKLLTLTFQVKGVGAELLGVHSVRLANSVGKRLSYTVFGQPIDATPTSHLSQVIVTPPEPQAPLAVGDIFTQTIEIRDAIDLVAWRMDIVFNPVVLEVLRITEGDFLKQDSFTPLFLSSGINSDFGRIIGLRQHRANWELDADGKVALQPPTSGVSGTGELVSITFRLKVFSEDLLGLQSVRLTNMEEAQPSFSVLTHPIVATHRYPPADVDRNGTVDIRDLVVVAEHFGQTDLINPRADVNNDEIVDILDLITVAGSQHWGESVAPTHVREPNAAAPTASVTKLTPETVQVWLNQAQIEDDGSPLFARGIANLKILLASKPPTEARLLSNYPNPFNPETWIPYQLAAAADVTVMIYSVNGSLIRTLGLGHQAPGVYQRKHRAAYWDGRNETGERVASGVYFYTLTAGDFRATGKMLVRK